MKTINLAEEEYQTLRDILEACRCEEAQDPDYPDYDEDYANTMKSIYIKFEVKYE